MFMNMPRQSWWLNSIKAKCNKGVFMIWTREGLFTFKYEAKRFLLGFHNEQKRKTSDRQLIVSRGTDSSITQVLDLTTIPYAVIVSYSHLNYPWLNFDVIILLFLIIKSGFMFMWSAQPSILTVVTVMLDDYLQPNPGVKDLPWVGIEP